jgi:hypothetical protein
MDEQNSDESDQKWIARARRAGELVDRVDLDEVAGHSPQVFEKLAKVAAALGELSAGRNVEYISDVDGDKAPLMDADKLRQSHRVIRSRTG